jgi:hypothetical protein
VLRACPTSNDKLERGDINPGLSAGDRGFEVFGKAAVAIEPGKGAFDNPSTGKDFEANGVGHALDDLDAPLAKFGECLHELIAGIGAVGEEVAQPREEVLDGFDDERRAIAVLYVGGTDRGSEHQADGIGHVTSGHGFHKIKHLNLSSKREIVRTDFMILLKDITILYCNLKNAVV